MKYLLTISIIFASGIFSVQAQWSIKGETTDKEASWYLFQKFTPEEWDASNFATEKEMERIIELTFGDNISGMAETAKL
jgi:hypothetical protein